jgi:hypothetical protein
MNRSLIVAASSLLLTATVIPAAPVAPPPRAVPPYFPTTVGAKWVYESKRGRTTEELVQVVSAVRPRPDGRTVVSVTAAFGELTHPLKTVVVSDEGLDWTGAHGGLFDRPAQLLKLPLRPGLTWKRQPEETATTMTAHGPERVKVPAGEFDCLRVEYRPNGVMTQTRWYARGVGEVKLFVQDPIDKSGPFDFHIVLKSFAPGKERDAP